MIVAVCLLQVVLNRPKYASLADYESKRSSELGSLGFPVLGPDAKVGWMDAEWVSWRTKSGNKRELIKFDRARRPIVEPKGEQAKDYVEPPRISSLPKF